MGLNFLHVIYEKFGCDLVKGYLIYDCNKYEGRVDTGGPVVMKLASGSEVRGFKLGRGGLIFPELKNPEYDFLRKRSKAVGPVS